MYPFMGSCGCAFADVPVLNWGGGWFFMAKNCSHMKSLLEGEAKKKEASVS